MFSDLKLKFERKNVNLLLAVDLLFFLQKGRNTSLKREKRAQDRRVRKLMKAAYKIPFYRKRFEEVGLKPEDFKCADDLYKFPILTKDELRAWMDEEVDKPQYKYYFLDTTS